MSEEVRKQTFSWQKRKKEKKKKQNYQNALCYYLYDEILPHESICLSCEICRLARYFLHQLVLSLSLRFLEDSF